MSDRHLLPSLLTDPAHTLRVILTNVPPAVADALARALVSEHVAACVNILPGVQSCYFWEGEVVQDVECTLLIKTDEEVLERCIGRLVELHPYTVPEVVVLNPERVLEGYASWARAATAGASEEP